MTRIIIALIAFVATQSFAGCLEDLMAGRIRQTEYAACVQSRTSTTTVARPTPTATPAASAANQTRCQAFDNCGRSCTDPNFSRPFCTAGAPISQQQLSWYQLAVLNWYYQAGYITPDYLAQILYQSADYNTQMRFQLISYFYGSDQAVNDLLQNFGFGGSYYGWNTPASPTATRSVWFGQSNAFQSFLRNAFLPQSNE